MTNEMRNEKIDSFIKKWNEMLKAANEIEDFKWKISVSITSDNSIKEDRVRTINAINKSFSDNNMSWTSTDN